MAITCTFCLTILTLVNAELGTKESNSHHRNTKGGMMMKKMSIFLVISLVGASHALAETDEGDGKAKKHFIGSTAFMLANLAPDSPNYYQLNYGYRLTPKDVISVEAITWEYTGPLGRPYGKDTKASDFPGRVQAYGVGFAYKRFLWQGLYSAFYNTPRKSDIKK